jgi:hypothetical protein
MLAKLKNLNRWVLALLVIAAGIVAVFALFFLIQLVPYGRNHTNPPVTSEPKWATPHARELAQRACFDCHSNETTWGWYTNIAPFSWLIQHDVDEGRQKLNFSEWATTRHSRELSEVILEGSMPPIQYTLPHPNSVLTDAEKQELADSLSGQ